VLYLAAGNLVYIVHRASSCQQNWRHRKLKPERWPPV